MVFSNPANIHYCYLFNYGSSSSASIFRTRLLRISHFLAALDILTVLFSHFFLPLPFLLFSSFDLCRYLPITTRGFRPKPSPLNPHLIQFSGSFISPETHFHLLKI